MKISLTETDDEIVLTHEGMESYKPISELGYEEVTLIDFLRGCEVEPVEKSRTPFKEILYNRVISSP